MRGGRPRGGGALRPRDGVHLVHLQHGGSLSWRTRLALPPEGGARRAAGGGRPCHLSPRASGLAGRPLLLCWLASSCCVCVCNLRALPVASYNGHPSFLFAKTKHKICVMIKPEIVQNSKITYKNPTSCTTGVIGRYFFEAILLPPWRKIWLIQDINDIFYADVELVWKLLLHIFSILWTDWIGTRLELSL